MASVPAEAPTSSAHKRADIMGRLENEMANQMGKRYGCTACGVEVVVTKAGDGALTCCNGEQMAQK